MTTLLRTKEQMNRLLELFEIENNVFEAKMTNRYKYLK